jgi:hypothetical protein
MILTVLALAACDVSTDVVAGGGTDTGTAEPFTVRMFVWQAEPGVCFEVENVAVDETLWAAWDERGCDEQNDAAPDILYGTADGRCIHIKGGLLGEYPTPAECRVNDPWVLPCDSVAGCCDRYTKDTACDGL